MRENKKIKNKSKRRLLIKNEKFSKNNNNAYFRKNIFEKSYYLPCFTDNRDKQYYGTLLSPTFY